MINKLCATRTLISKPNLTVPALSNGGFIYASVVPSGDQRWSDTGSGMTYSSANLKSSGLSFSKFP